MQLTLKVEDLNVKLGDSSRKVLNSVCAYVKPGQVLAVMGPSGCGKTTLLSALSGRIRSTGRILFNGTQLNKSLRRKICYVLQSDVFFPNLTLRQTLTYAAMLRLPDSMSYENKMRKVDQIIDVLDLRNCQHTTVGDGFTPGGLSGGERKRCSIACELISNPSVMILDEPTSSLDSCTAMSLINTLKQYAIKEQKTIIMSIHQPSSQMFYSFDKLLLMSRGEMLYFGTVQQVLPFFNHFNYHMQRVSYNPADFIMEIAKSVDDKELSKLSKEARECYHATFKRNSLENNLSILDKLHQSSEIDREKSGNKMQHQFVPPLSSTQKQHHQEQNAHQEKHQSHDTKQIEISQEKETKQNHEDVSSSIYSSWSKIYIYEQSDDDDFSCACDVDFGQQCCKKENRWPSSFTTQLRALTSRTFIDTKARILSPLNWLQTISFALFAGILCFRKARSEEELNDIKGLLFLPTMFWMMFALFNTITSYPSEFQVINKERSAGSYRLSSYYLAKMIGDLPLVIALPSAFHLISYPMFGMQSLSTFFIIWGMVILNTLAAQSIGMFIAFAFKRMDVALTAGALYSNATMLFGGFFATKVPVWLNWLRYTSIVHYGFLNMQIAEFTYGPPISCAQGNSKYSSCLAFQHHNQQQNLDQMHSQDSNSSLAIHRLMPTKHAGYISNEEVLLGADPGRPDDLPYPIWFNTLCLVAFMVIFRVLGYWVMSKQHKPT